MRTVLLVKDNIACWFKWEGARLAAVYSCVFAADTASQAVIDSSSMCPTWADADLQNVELVIDSAAHDIQVQPFALSSNYIARVGSWRSLIKQLTSEDSHVVAYEQLVVDRKKGLLVHSFNLDDVNASWLDHLCLHRITVKTVTSLSQKLAYRTLPRNSHSLLVFRTPDQVRHVYCVNAQVHFVRTLTLSGSHIEIITGVEETHSHLVAHNWAAEQYDIYLLGLNEAVRLQLDALSFVLSVNVIDTSSFGSLNPDSVPTEHADHISVPYGLERLGVWLTPVVKEPYIKPLNNSVWTFSFFSKKRLQKLQIVLFALAFALLVFLVLAVLNSIDSARKQTALSQQQSTMSKSVAELDEYLRSITQSYQQLANALHQASVINGATTAPINEMMLAVAKVYTEHADVNLASLNWYMLDRFESWSVFDQQLPELLEQRKQFSADSETTNPLAIVLAGNVNVSLSLADQQRMFEAFVLSLKTIESIVEVSVVSAPIDAIQSGIQSSGLNNEEESLYALRFLYIP